METLKAALESIIETCGTVNFSSHKQMRECIEACSEIAEEAISEKKENPQEYASLNQDGQDELWEEFVGEFNKAYASDLSLIDSFNKLKSLYHITKKQVR